MANEWHKTTCNVCCYSNLRNLKGFLTNKKPNCDMGHTIRVVRKGFGFEYQSTNCYLIIGRINKTKEGLKDRELAKK